MSSVFHVEILTLYAEPLASLPASIGIHNTNVFIFGGGSTTDHFFYALHHIYSLPFSIYTPPPPSPLLSSPLMPCQI